MDSVKRIFVPDINVNFQTISETKEIEEIEETNEMKKVIFTGTTTKYQMKKVYEKKDKDKKKKVETNTWGLNESELSFQTQLQVLKDIHNSSFNKLSFLSVSHIKTKISSYKHQDILKNIFLEPEFVTFDYVIDLLNSCELKCHYCSCEMYLLYEFVREMKQWSLDRIDNDVGHNKNNLVVSCLECNLKRRRTNKDAFFITKNLTITKL
jgi:DNA repair photolyase